MPLDAAARGALQGSYGVDLSPVRVHTDARAAASAQAVGACAYTVGSDIVFGAGEYDPASSSGGWLLAHELAHVAQQSDGAPTLRRQQAQVTPNAIDARAMAIIQAAQDQSLPIATRAVQVVRSIVDTYYPSQAAKIGCPDERAAADQAAAAAHPPTVRAEKGRQPCNAGADSMCPTPTIAPRAAAIALDRV
jgi:hypothetical protein